MWHVLAYVFAFWLALLFVDGSVAFKIFSLRAWRKFLWKSKRDWDRIGRKERWHRFFRKKTSAVPRGISPR